MNRQVMNQLIKWKGSKSRKPLIIRGARQVGKTWLMREFGKSQYKKVAYVNLESSGSIRAVFQADFNINRILLAIQIETGIQIDPNTTLIILDKIQEAEKAITSLKYFQENAPEYHIICAGSLLGVALHSHTSFPVGKVDFIDLHPLNFIEFLEATDRKLLVEALKSHDWILINSFKDQLIQHLKEYYFVGGMPEAVSRFAEDLDMKGVREIQRQILIAYELDFSKHAPTAIAARIRMLWNSMPAQLAKENKKFIYGALRPGARAKDYELAISWLIDCGLITKVSRISKPAIPLKAYSDETAFKLFLADTGLLGAMNNLDVKTVIEGNLIFQEFKGALTEQYVLQQLLTIGEVNVHYWSAENARAEVDFVLQYEGKIVPVEVKAEENLKARSLSVFSEKYRSKICIRTSMSDFRQQEGLINLPLYAISEIGSII
ncbi:ATP-binding protein [Arachidicoccus sp.]|uniref:ATP-binding protein n=1 Tax=Arachidicoccus sp. TaxID=1872624 RepID=UPI003D1A0EF7